MSAKRKLIGGAEMNSRYIFRGKDISGEWHYGDLEWFTDDFVKIVNHKIHEYGKKVETETVGQCTGLKDKNGKLIFEGDVVKNKAWYVIKYENGGYGLSGFGKMKPIPIMGHWNFNSDEIEIIGNIHDNPELLQRSDEVWRMENEH